MRAALLAVTILITTAALAQWDAVTVQQRTQQKLDGGIYGTRVMGTPWPIANQYLPVRLTDGTTFYTASGGGGGGAASEVTVDGGYLYAYQSGAWNVGVTGSVAVTGTFWPVTQPVSGTVTANAGTGPFPISDNGGSITVDGTFWQATQPVSGTFWQATQPVSGTFWQATQPVSGPLTDAQLRATPVPVSGTFWQATQPISGTVTVNTTVASITSASTVGTQATVTTTSSSVLASNVNRKFAEVCNEGTVDVYLKLGATATSSNKVLQPGRCFTVQPAGNSIYTGVLDMIAASGSQTVSRVEW